MRGALIVALLLGASLVGCARPFERRLEYGVLPSPAVGGRELGYALWAPPDFDGTERLPLVVFLHGGGDDETAFDRAGLGPVLDRAVGEGRIPRLILLLPRGELGFWANWYDGSRRYEDWVVDELLPRIAHRHRTLPCPEGCHLMGVSMGGSGALRFALHRPAQWASATVMSAPVLDTDQMISVARNPLFVPLIPMDRIWGPIDRARVARDDPFLRWRSPEDLAGLRLMVAWGSRDRGAIIASSRRLHRHLEHHGITHETLEFNGEHAWRSWGPAILEALHRMVPPSPWAHQPDTVFTE